MAVEREMGALLRHDGLGDGNTSAMEWVAGAPMMTESEKADAGVVG